MANKQVLRNTSIDIKLPDDFAATVKEFADKVQGELDSLDQCAPCWVLIDDAGKVQPWKLIISKYGVCWQNQIVRSQFMPCFTRDDGRTKNGFTEVIRYLPVTLLRNKSSLLVKRSGQL